jgi:hypothetical protein
MAFRATMHAPTAFAAASERARSDRTEAYLGTRGFVVSTKAGKGPGWVGLVPAEPPERARQERSAQGGAYRSSQESE